MKKQLKRWYEKDDYTRAFMNMLQNLDSEKQCEIAVDLILKASNLIDRDYEKIVNEVAVFDPKDYRRWYDKNPNIHLAIESLRDLTPEQREELFEELNHYFVENEDIEVIELRHDIEETKETKGNNSSEENN